MSYLSQVYYKIKGVYMMKNKKLIILSVLIIAAGITFAGCDSEITSSVDNPESIQPGQPVTNMAKGQSSHVSEIQSLINFNTGQAVDGEVVLKRRLKNNTFSWQLKTSAFDAGNAYTVWIGNFPNFDNGGGWGAGGIVGGNGKFTASGNHCVWPLETFSTGGFRPGAKSDCNMVDLEQPIWFFVLDHGDWEPGDMLARWDPTSGTGDESVLGKVLFAFFP